MNRRSVNIGCGTTCIPGVFGVDLVSCSLSVNVIADLGRSSLPFLKGSLDEIHMYHVLEHLGSPIKVLEDVHDTLICGGVVHVRVPHFSSVGAFEDITHVRPFAYHSFDVFTKGHERSFYTACRFWIKSKRIKYLGRYPNYGIYEQYVHRNSCPWFLRPAVHCLNALIELSPVAFERIWCYWVGGACEIELEMIKTVESVEYS